MDRTWKQIITPAALGIGACVACCAAPLLTLFVGAGAASSIAAVAEPVAGLLLASGFVVGGVVLVRRQRARAATSRSCGCGPSLDVKTAQAAGCTLDAAQIPDRGEAFRSLFSRALTRRETSPLKAVWTLAWSQAVEAEARPSRPPRPGAAPSSTSRCTVGGPTSCGRPGCRRVGRARSR